MQVPFLSCMYIKEVYNEERREEGSGMKTRIIGNCNSPYHEQAGSDCIVLLPGFGYLFDRPLLAEMKQLALQYGFSVLELSFGRLPYDKQQMKASIDRCVPIALQIAQETLDGLSDKTFHFVGKSFGTIIACLLREHADGAVLAWTPLKQTLPMLQSRDHLAYGNQDPFLDEEDLQTLAQLPCMDRLFCEGANHSLCHPDPKQSEEYLAAAKQMMKRFLDEILSEREYNKSCYER